MRSILGAVLDDGAEALLDVGRHRELAGSGVGLGLLNHKRHIFDPMKKIDFSRTGLKVAIASKSNTIDSKQSPSGTFAQSAAVSLN